MTLNQNVQVKTVSEFQDYVGEVLEGWKKGEISRDEVAEDMLVKTAMLRQVKNNES